MTKLQAIPQKFAQKLRAKLEDYVCLKGPSGATWNVRMTGNEDSLFLKHGGKEFVDAHSLVEGDLLIFKYNGNSLFDVLVFDRQSSCKKEASYFLKKCEHADVASGGRTKRPTPERNDTTSESSSSKQTSESSSHEEFEPRYFSVGSIDLLQPIPSERARIHLPRMNLDVTLRFEENTWQTDFIHTHHGCALTGPGWRNFVLENFL